MFGGHNRRSSNDDWDFACGGSPVDLGKRGADFYATAANELEEEENRRTGNVAPYSAPPIVGYSTEPDNDPFARGPIAHGYISPVAPYSASPIPSVSDCYVPRRPPRPDYGGREIRDRHQSREGPRVSAYPFPVPPPISTEAPPRPLVTRGEPSSPSIAHSLEGHFRVLSSSTAEVSTYRPLPPIPSLSHRGQHRRTASTAVTPTARDVPRITQHPGLRSASRERVEARHRARSVRTLPGPPPIGPLPPVPVE